ncbi:phage head closure protein [Afifella sp. IM 167]|uniref:phage head closure protein n=1 Tax=Afifella sp. IM 167 TaxID=2033586 RepID=UPI001CCF1116|nr:phage head closure protein [Afifella sp. IM 167]MBZ8135509.1 head-tail adaptor protein [Afifella sp. IM 167]
MSYPLRRAASRPGRLRHRLTWERPVAVPDGAGGESVTFEEAGAFWAEIRPVAAHDKRLGEGRVSEVTHRVFLRAGLSVASGDRLTKGARRFRVLTAHDPEEAGRYTELFVKEERP